MHFKATGDENEEIMSDGLVTLLNLKYSELSVRKTKCI